MGKISPQNLRASHQDERDTATTCMEYNRKSPLGAAFCGEDTES